MEVKDILENEDFSKENLIRLLSTEGENRTLLFKKSAEEIGRAHV